MGAVPPTGPTLVAAASGGSISHWPGASLKAEPPMRGAGWLPGACPRSRGCLGRRGFGLEMGMRPPLCVDLDGTLIKTDLLYETLLAALRGRPWIVLLLPFRSEEHTSELQSLMRISYAVFCLKTKNITYTSEQHKN